MSDVISAAAPLTRRESNKADKLRRIEQAARSLFLEKGYDETTVREVASRAGVGFGTIFSYVTDKAELVYLIRNNEMEALLGEILPRARAAANLEEQILTLTEAVFRLFRGQSQLSKIIRRELTAHHDGIQGKRFAETRGRILSYFAECISTAQASGAVRSAEEPELLAQTLFALMSFQLRRGEAEAEAGGIDAGLAYMNRMLRSVLSGWMRN